MTDDYNYIRESENGMFLNQSDEQVNIENCNDMEVTVSEEEINNANVLAEYIEESGEAGTDNAEIVLPAGSANAENTPGGIIVSIPTYLKNYAGSQYVYTYISNESLVLSGVGTNTMTPFIKYEINWNPELKETDVNNCSLVALCNALVYYRDVKNYSNIPSSRYDLYYGVRMEAKALGYTPKKGIGVTKLNNLVTNVFKRFGYNVSDLNWYPWLDSTIKSNIKTYGPVILSFASKPYYNHSIMVYGYKKYAGTNGGYYNFYIVRDGWNSGYRYVAGRNAGSNVSCLTTIKAR